MKKFFVVLVGFMVFGTAAQAKQKATPKEQLPKQQMMICDGTMGSMCPMMDAMPVMLQVMKLQQQLDEGVTGSEKKVILADKAKLIEALDSAMVKMTSVPMPCMSQPMPCAPPKK
ncbi:MAG: hypothetical protein HGB02_02240 [Chlorobiaceae bacterium]|nr:hypothetical protein [Chlorobiaceae bacterium]